MLPIGTMRTVIGFVNRLYARHSYLVHCLNQPEKKVLVYCERVLQRGTWGFDSWGFYGSFVQAGGTRES